MAAPVLIGREIAIATVIGDAGIPFTERHLDAAEIHRPREADGVAGLGVSGAFAPHRESAFANGSDRGQGWLGDAQHV